MSRCVNRVLIVVMMTMGCIMTVKVKSNYDSVITYGDNDVVSSQFLTHSTMNETKSGQTRLEPSSNDNVRVEHCDNMLSCVNRDLYKQVTSIIAHSKYKLSDNLIFEKQPITGNSNVTSDEESATGVLLERNGVTTLVLMKKMMDIFKSHVLRLRLLRNVDIAVFKEKPDGGLPKLAVALESTEDTRGARTFGHGVLRRRIVFVLLAIMFKLGAMSAMLWVLLVLTLKGLKIGVVLIMLSISNFAARYVPKIGFPTILPDVETKTPTHIHVHGAPSPSQSWPQEELGVVNPYPYPFPAYQQSYGPQYPPWKNIYPGHKNTKSSLDDPRFPLITTRSSLKPRFSVYYQRKNGQFHPIVLNNDDLYGSNDDQMDQSSNYYMPHRRSDEDVLEEYAAELKPNRRNVDLK